MMISIGSFPYAKIKVWKQAKLCEQMASQIKCALTDYIKHMQNIKKSFPVGTGRKVQMRMENDTQLQTRYSSVGKSAHASSWYASDNRLKYNTPLEFIHINYTYTCNLMGNWFKASKAFWNPCLFQKLSSSLLKELIHLALTTYVGKLFHWHVIDHLLGEKLLPVPASECHTCISSALFSDCALLSWAGVHVLENLKKLCQTHGES